MSTHYYYKEGHMGIGLDSKISLPFTLPYAVLLYLKSNDKNKIHEV